MNWTNSAALVLQGGIMSPSGTSRHSPVLPMAMIDNAALGHMPARGQMFSRQHCFVLVARRRRFWALCRK
jgi:hypothetical protein